MVTKILRDQRIPIIWFVANCGGILGLCMGFSIGAKKIGLDCKYVRGRDFFMCSIYSPLRKIGNSKKICHQRVNIVLFVLPEIFVLLLKQSILY